ncbi:PREDICTED: ATP-dependent DNA helicase PIF1-like, partial [Amphimedon queenslandica]|uniref:ATP-dependent DNA helicase n=2 Tax=Amphimedon queenslandica TaxID=400682 RepID=A0AAN0JSB9_AMPQE
EVYTTVRQHFESTSQEPLHIIINGTAGTGKSYLINCLRLLLGGSVRVAAPTGVASFIIEGRTLHSLLHLPVRGDFKEMEGSNLQKMQDELSSTKYLIIDEMSMVGRKIFGMIARRLRQAFPSKSQVLFGGCSVFLFGDFGQLPPVMDLPLYTSVTRSDLSDQGYRAYSQFETAFTLTQLFPTVEAVVNHNVAMLRECGHPIATIKAVHTGANAAKTPPDDAGGLEPVVMLARTARVMLTSNLWVEVGLVNGAMGTVEAICYKETMPPHLPVAVMVRFDHYTGPTVHDGTVPITPIRHNWSSSGGQCSRLQLPLKLAWAVTIHKSQGLTLDKVVIDVGKKEFSCGLTFVACSRVRKLKDILFMPLFPLPRLKSIANNKRLQERKEEDQRLLSLQETTAEPTIEDTSHMEWI